MFTHLRFGDLCRALSLELDLERLRLVLLSSLLRLLLLLRELDPLRDLERPDLDSLLLLLLDLPLLLLLLLLLYLLLCSPFRFGGIRLSLEGVRLLLG